MLANSPQITPRLAQDKINLKRFVDVLRCDDQPESLTFVQKWDTLTPADRSIAGVEAIALSCGLTPRRVWELFKGASLMQGMESTQVKISEAMPRVIDRVIKTALTARGEMAQERLMKAARILPTPKGNTTVINMPGRSDDEEEQDDERGALESADEFMLKASRAMNPKALPPPPDDDADDVVVGV